MTDRERFKEALERILADWNYIDREEFNGIFKSFAKSTDTFVREKSKWGAAYVLEAFPEHTKQWAEDCMKHPEFGMKYESDGDVHTKDYTKDNITAAKMHIGRLKKKNIEAKLLESEDKVVVKWTEKKED